jgi:hypothetical protein
VGVTVVFVAMAGLTVLTAKRLLSPTPSSRSATDPGNGASPSGGRGQAVDGIPCEKRERLGYHVHAHLRILKDGVEQPVSAYAGIPGAPLLPSCYYWVHTHDRSGVIHIEAPTDRSVTLGQFFDIWGWPLTPTRVVKLAVPSGGLKTFVDGEPYEGDPRQITLARHTQVVLELGKEVPPPVYDFSSPSVALLSGLSPGDGSRLPGPPGAH